MLRLEKDNHAFEWEHKGNGNYLEKLFQLDEYDEWMLIHTVDSMDEKAVGTFVAELLATGFHFVEEVA